MSISPRVVDMFHGDDLVHGDPVAAFKQMEDAGYWGVIHKANQGVGSADPAFADRMKAVAQTTMARGAYHFNTGDTVTGQLEHFFDVVQPDAKTMMALDFEDNRASNMSLAQAVDFLMRGKEMLKRSLWIYSGNRIKELIVNASAEVRQVFGSCPLWLCEYGPVARMTDVNGHPLPWAKPTLWQFTGDGVGPLPHTVPGMTTRGLDINSYDGTRDQFVKDWTGA